MADFATVAAIFCALATAIHLISAALALSRFASVSSKTRCSSGRSGQHYSAYLRARPLRRVDAAFDV